MLQTWTIQEAATHLHRVIEKATHEGDQLIILDEREAAVIISKKRYDSLSCQNNSLIEFFKRAPYPDIDLE